MENEIIEVCDDSADENETQNVLNQSQSEPPNFSQLVSSYYQTLLSLTENGPSMWSKLFFKSVKKKLFFIFF